MRQVEKQAEELSQLARFLFDAAANKWYSAAALDVINGLVAGILGLLDLTGSKALIPAVVGIALLFVSFGLRLWAETQYDTAETMRRQAALSEALGWPLSKVQMDEWLRKTGLRRQQRLATTPRPPDYYKTQQHVGPERLAEMTIESAFYTRHLYARLQVWSWILFVGALVLSFFVASFAFLRVLPDDKNLLIARALYAFIPIIVTSNLLGWALKLGRLKAAILDVEEDFERLQDTGNVNDAQVLRLVSEYNCQVVAGLPVHNWLFGKWHNGILEQWNRR